jgi:hypothetical protein
MATTAPTAPTATQPQAQPTTASHAQPKAQTNGQDPSHHGHAYRHKLGATTTAFIRLHEWTATSAKPTKEKFLALRTTNAQSFWGHIHGSKKLGAPASADNETSWTRFAQFLPAIAAVDADIHDMVVDENHHKVAVRVTFKITPAGQQTKEKGKETVIENDVVWILKMSEDGEKIERSTEFVDLIAAKDLVEFGKAAPAAEAAKQ